MLGIRMIPVILWRIQWKKVGICLIQMLWALAQLVKYLQTKTFCVQWQIYKYILIRLLFGLVVRSGSTLSSKRSRGGQGLLYALTKVLISAC